MVYEFKTLFFLAISTFLILLGGSSISADFEKPVESPIQKQEFEGIKNIEGVKGKVVCEKDTPIEGVLIQAESLDAPSLPVPEIAIITDTNGNYFWRLQPGRYKITAFSECYKISSKEVNVKKGDVVITNFILKKARQKNKCIKFNKQ